MAKRDKLLDKLLRGTSQTSRSPIFAVCCSDWGLSNHHIFTRNDVEEILNLQPKQAKAKPYQVKQVRAVIHRYQLAGDDHDDK